MQLLDFQLMLNIQSIKSIGFYYSLNSGLKRNYRSKDVNLFIERS